MTLHEITERIARKVAARRRVGWFDFSLMGYDMRMCTARAYRVQQRLGGHRITLRQALYN